MIIINFSDCFLRTELGCNTFIYYSVMNLNEAYCSVKEIKIQNSTGNTCFEGNIKMCDNESYAHVRLVSIRKTLALKFDYSYGACIHNNYAI